MIRIIIASMFLTFYIVNSKAQSCVTILEPAALSINCSKVDVTTDGGINGEVSVVVAGGTSPYTYLWSNGSTTSQITGLAIGNYTVTVTDDNGCSKECKTQVNSPTCTLPSAGTDLTLACNGNQHLNTTQLVAASAGYTWYVLQQPIGANATIDNMGLVQGMTQIGEYVFQLRQDNYPTCKDDVKIIAPNCVTPCPTNKCGTVSVRKL